MSARTIRPSASVFVISIDLPLRALTTSPGRLACEPMRFSARLSTPMTWPL